VLAWIGCNAILVAFISSGSFQSLLPASEQTQSQEEYRNSLGIMYTGFILWMVAATSAVRFIGSLLYLVLGFFNL
jgi:chitin synthase